MSSFYSNPHSEQLNVFSSRYPSYLIKVSPPQMYINQNNMLLLPKICNKYSVRRKSNSVTNIIICDDVLSVRSTMELNTTSMKPTINKIKMTNKITNDNTSFDNSSRESFESFIQSTHYNFRYPSYLIKISHPQMYSNINQNNMLLLPKICNKYNVRRNSNSVTNIINHDDVSSVKSIVELNNTTSIKPAGNKIKITNRAAIDDYTSFDSESRDNWGSYQESTTCNLRYPSSLAKVSPPLVCSNIENMLMQNNNKVHHIDEVCVKSSLEDVKLINLNDNKIETNKFNDVNQEDNFLTLNTSDFKTEDITKTKTRINCTFNNYDNQEQITTEDFADDVKLIKICKKCHKGWHVKSFDWKKVSKINKIKLLEIIKQNSRTEEPIPFLVNHNFNYNSNQHLSINETKCLDKTQNNISI